MKRLLCLLALVIFAILASSVSAQELDEFVYLPIIIKSPQPPDCNFYEPNDTPGQANWIQDGETQTHCIVPKTDVDWVKFSVNTESEVIIEAADESGDLEVWLYDDSLNELDHDYSYLHRPAQIDRNCGNGRDPLAAGTYYVKVEHWLNSEEIPNYSVMLTTVPCPTLVLTNYSHWGNLNVVGEVENNGEAGVIYSKVIVNVFDSGNQLTDTAVSWIDLDVLPPGDKTCFRANLYEAGDWSYYTFEPPIYSGISNDQLRNMTVYGDSGIYNSGAYRILGFVRNDNDFQVGYVEPIATLYNASGTVIGCENTVVNSSHLDPGQSSSFEIQFYFSNWNGEDVDSYRIQVDGNAQ